MKNSILSLILLFPLFVFGQVAKHGIIVPAIDSLKTSEKYCCVLSPEQGFSVYDNPNGKVIGILRRAGDIKKDDQVPYSIYFVTNDKKVKVDNYREIAYEIYAINYTDSIHGFIKVLNPLESYWLNVTEISKRGFKTVSWVEYLISQSENELGYYANEPGLRLRKEPDPTSEIIGSVRGDLFEIKLTNDTEGQWCKVKITKYKEHPCSTELSEHENVEYKSEGWLKIIDDHGEPNLWSYTRGC